MAKAEKKIVVTPPQGTKPASVESVDVPQQLQPQPASVGQPVSTQGQQIDLKMPSDVTAENWMTFPASELITKFGNLSNCMRGLVHLGIKPGPISKHLGKRYQHVRNVTTRPLKRQEAAKRQKERAATGPTVPVNVGLPANAPKGSDAKK